MNVAYFSASESLLLESGAELTDFSIAYSTYGVLNEDQSNVIWVVHALTGDSKVADWWSGLIGEQRIFNFSSHYIICANLLGSGYGSSNALSLNPATGTPYFYDFPQLTTRDLAKSLEALRQNLGIKQIHTLIGGSLGGQVALEWSYSLGNALKHAIIIASTAKTSPWVIGFNEAQRMAIEADSTWGEYHSDAGKKGLEAARAIAMLSYRHPLDLNNKQKEVEEKLDGFLASSYLRYQGSKLAQRFHAFSYWTLTKAMDSHDIGRDRGGVETALKSIKARVLAVGVDSDLLFLAEEAKYLSQAVHSGSYGEIVSTAGHDAFLIEFAQLSALIENFYLQG